MATVTLRQIKGSALTNTEVDANLTSINAETVDNSTVYNLRPSLDVDLVGSKTVSPLMGFSRASTATYYDANGVLRTAGVNEPRFNHDPVTGELKGLLIEDSRTNLLTYSEQFDNAAWRKLNDGKILANQSIAPDGTTTADLFYPNTTGLQRFIAHDIQYSWIGTYSYSFYAKQAGFRHIGMFNPIGNGIGVNFDLATGVVTNYMSGTVTATMIPVANGFYRCVYSSTGGYTAIYLSDTIGSYTATANGTAGVYIWGAQLEAGSTATSYIPTTSTPVTRAADTLTINKSSNWFNSVNGTLALAHDALSGQPVISEGTNTLVTSLGSGTVNVDYSNSQLSVVTQTGQTANTQGVFNFDSDLYIMGNSATKANAHVRYLKFYPNNVIGSTPAGSGFILDDGYALMQEDGSVIFQE